MATVLLKNTSWPSEASFRREKEVFSPDWTWWNIWQRMQPPWDLLTDDSLVLLTNSWQQSGTVQGELSCLVRARNVLREACRDKDDAIGVIALWQGTSRRRVALNQYTARANPNSRYVLGLQAELVRNLAIARPSKLVFLRNGWKVSSTQELAGWGVTFPTRGSVGTSTRPRSVRRPTGTGRQLDTESRLAVEHWAEQTVMKELVRRGWSGVRSVSHLRQPWDLEGVDPKGNDRRIECKGTVGGDRLVELTANEVHTAQKDRDYVLGICSSVQVRVVNGIKQATRGKVLIIDPWVPEKKQLTVTGYKWRRP
jgi:hypothetical protein